jgi:hypothetical protein
MRSSITTKLKLGGSKIIYSLKSKLYLYFYFYPSLKVYNMKKNIIIIIIIFIISLVLLNNIKYFTSSQKC